MKRTYFVIFAISLLLMAFTNDALAQRGPGGGSRFIMEKLDLSDAQEDQISKLRVDHQKEMIDLREAVRQTRDKIRDLMESEDVSRENFLALHREMNEKRNAVSMARAEHKMDIYELLTEDQKQKMRQLRDSFFENRTMRSGDGRGRHHKGRHFGF